MTLALRNHRDENGFRFHVLAAVFLALYIGLCGSAWAQQLGRGADDGISVWRVVAALLVCGGVTMVAALVLKHRMQGGGALFRPNRAGPRLAMIESLRLRPQTELCIVSCDKDEFLIVISPQGTHLLRPLSNGMAQDTPLIGEP